MNRIVLAIALIASISFKINAQDEALFNHYIFNPQLINPAYSGFNNNIQLFGHMRNQWTGFPGAPTTYDVTVSAPISDKVGLGGMLLTERFGMMNRLRGQLSYAYRYDNGKGIKWSAGFSTEFHRSKIDASILDPTKNPFLERGDDVLEQHVQGVTIFDATFGACAVIYDKMFFSVSTPNLIRARLGKIENSTEASRSTFLRQVILMGGYRVTGNRVTVEPSLAIRKVYESPFEVDFNVKCSFLEDRLVAGLSVRPGTSGQVALIVGTKQPGFQVYYSYASSLAELNTYNRNSHEVTLGLDIKKSEGKAKGRKGRK